jgi:hypothetical protein
VGALSLRGQSRSATNRNQVGLAAIVENSFLWCLFATLDGVLIEHVFRYGIRGTVVPSRIVIEVKSDRSDRANADIRASPAASLREELNSDFEIRVFHQNMLA